VATNPVDILTYVAQELSQRPAEHIIGTGTLLDTARFRALLGQYYGVDPRSVHAYILGEHGDSEVAIWSQVAIGGQRILDRTVLGRPFDRERMQQIFEEARRAAYAIIERKGYTNTAIGVVIARLVEAILDDEKSVLPVSVRLNGEYGIRDVCLSIPCVIGLQGIEGRVLPSWPRTNWKACAARPKSSSSRCARFRCSGPPQTGNLRRKARIFEKTIHAVMNAWRF